MSDVDGPDSGRSGDDWDASEDLPAVGSDPAVLDAWVHGRFREWRPMAAMAALSERYEDADLDPHSKAVIACWLVGTFLDAGDAGAAALVADPGVPLPTRARLMGVLARARAEVGMTEGVDDLASGALTAVETGGIEPDIAVRILRNVVETALMSGDDAVAERAVSDALALDLSDPVVAFRLDVLRLLVANDRRRRSVDSMGDEDLAAVAAVAAQDVLDSAPEVLDGSSPDPLTVMAVLDATSTAMELGRDAPSPVPLRLVLEALPANDENAVLRAQAHLLAADLVLSLDGPALAMSEQRLAIAAAEASGSPSLLAWSRRGLAMHLHQLGRFDEALVEFDTAAGLLRAEGEIATAWLVEAARARCLLDAGDAEGAEATANAIVEEFDRSDGVAGADRNDDDTVAATVEAVLEVAVEAAMREERVDRAADLVERLATMVEADGRPCAVPWSLCALLTARAGEVGRAEELFLRAELSARPGPGPAHDHDLAVVGARRAEMLWQLDDNEEAIAVADVAAVLARSAGDDHLAVVTDSVAARAAHDLFRHALEDGEPGTVAAGERAVEALVNAIQDAQSLDIDDLAEHLGDRLELLRRDLDGLSD